MGRKIIYIVLIAAAIGYPVVLLLEAFQGVVKETDLLLVQQDIAKYQLSVWIGWILFCGMAVYEKWNYKSNLLFYLTYGFLCIGFFFLAILVIRSYSQFNTESITGDPVTIGIFSALPNLLLSVVLTGLVQGAVWWFTRNWRR